MAFSAFDGRVARVIAPGGAGWLAGADEDRRDQVPSQRLDVARMLADLLRFPVTTVAQDVETIGHTAFGMLMQIREGHPAPATSLVPPRLVVR